MVSDATGRDTQVTSPPSVPTGCQLSQDSAQMLELRQGKGIAPSAISRRAHDVADTNPLIATRFGSTGDVWARRTPLREAECSSSDRSASLRWCAAAAPVVPSPCCLFPLLGCLLLGLKLLCGPLGVIVGGAIGTIAGLVVALTRPDTEARGWADGRAAAGLRQWTRAELRLRPRHRCGTGMAPRRRRVGRIFNQPE
jgi:hypothetical protein